MFVISEKDLTAMTRMCKASAWSIGKFVGASFDIAFSHHMLAVRKIFDTEGPGWEPLSPYTIRMRKIAGFAAGPILQRTGSLYRSLVDYKMGSQTIESFSSSGGGLSSSGPLWEQGESIMRGYDIVTQVSTGNELRAGGAGANRAWSLVILDDRFALNQWGGWSGRNMVPPRPMLPDGWALLEAQESLKKHLYREVDAILWNRTRQTLGRGSAGGSAREGYDYIWRDRTIRTSDWSTDTQWSEAPWF
jgi:hypothetical protein